jgi:arginyl-tRNA synthetase
MILDDLRFQLNAALSPWAKAQGLESLPLYALEEPPAGIEADVACNLALLLAKPLRKSPRALAEELHKVLEGLPLLSEGITIAGAGFLNFRWPLKILQAELNTILNNTLQYGRRPDTTHQKILIEFVSANPTGPLHVGHGRGAALGDSLALILSHLGYQVTREYYINDAGNQVQMLGESLLARCSELEGKAVIFPENGYHGDYVKDLAKEFSAEVPAPDRTLEKAIAFAVARMTKAIEQDLNAFGVRFDSWFSEAGLVRKCLVEKFIEMLRAKGCVEEAEGAVWFVNKTPSPLVGEGRDGGVPPPQSSPTRGEEVGDKNRVLKKKDGKWTYFATDIAYHADKFERGYDRLIDIWGADHHGYVPRVKGSMQALGYDANRLHVILNQLVALTRNGVPVVMSKRSGEFVTLRDVLDEVGKDACRFFFAMRGPNTALDFDLELAKKHTVDNPVYYLQYAHARICSIFRQAASINPLPPLRGKVGMGGTPPPQSSPAEGGGEEIDLSPLKEKEERELMKRLALFPQVLLVCSHEDSPHPLTQYLLLLARQFHHFYDHHRVLGEDPALTQARLGLLEAVRTILKLGLALLGVSAPDSM